MQVFELSKLFPRKLFIDMLFHISDSMYLCGCEWLYGTNFGPFVAL